MTKTANTRGKSTGVAMGEMQGTSMTKSMITGGESSEGMTMGRT